MGGGPGAGWRLRRATSSVLAALTPRRLTQPRRTTVMKTAMRYASQQCGPSAPACCCRRARPRPPPAPLAPAVSATASTSCGQTSRGRSWPMPGIAISSAPGIASAVARPPRNGTSGSSRPWITVVGTAASAARAVRSPDARIAAELARRCRRVVAAVVGRGGQLADARPRRAGSRGDPISLNIAHEVLDVGLAVAAAPGASARSTRAASAGPTRRSPGRRHDRGERQHPLRVRDRHRLGDHPAHRRARPRGRASMPRWSSSPNASSAMSLEPVGRLDRCSPSIARRRFGHRRVDLGRAADVAVVEADHAEAAVGEQLAELEVPVDQLHARAP